MKLTDDGATVVSVETADRDGELANITLDGPEDQLAVNNDPNHLHGGKKGFDAMVGKAVEVKTDDAAGEQ